MIVSPPPATLNASDLDRLRDKFFVDSENCSFSNTPNGPFQRTVSAFSTTSLISLLVLVQNQISCLLVLKS